MASATSLVALLHGPDRPGLVARVAGWIFERGGNILHADQHQDAERDLFLMRVEWDRIGHLPNGDPCAGYEPEYGDRAEEPIAGR